MLLLVFLFVFSLRLSLGPAVLQDEPLWMKVSLFSKLLASNGQSHAWRLEPPLAWSNTNIQKILHDSSCRPSCVCLAGLNSSSSTIISALSLSYRSHLHFHGCLGTCICIWEWRQPRLMRPMSGDSDGPAPERVSRAFSLSVPVSSSKMSSLQSLGPVQSWLGQELEKCGIDAMIYTRYVLSLLLHDSYDYDLQDQV